MVLGTVPGQQRRTFMCRVATPVVVTGNTPAFMPGPPRTAFRGGALRDGAKGSGGRRAPGTRHAEHPSRLGGPLARRPSGLAPRGYVGRHAELGSVVVG